MISDRVTSGVLAVTFVVAVLAIGGITYQARTREHSAVTEAKATAATASRPAIAARTVTIEVTGDYALRFKGSIGGADGLRSVDDYAPTTFTVNGTRAAATLQKAGVNDTLTVTLSCGKSQSTTAAYGVVSVAC